MLLAKINKFFHYFLPTSFISLKGDTAIDIIKIYLKTFLCNTFGHLLEGIFLELYVQLFINSLLWLKLCIKLKRV